MRVGVDTRPLLACLAQGTRLCGIKAVAPTCTQALTLLSHLPSTQSVLRSVICYQKLGGKEQLGTQTVLYNVCMYM